MATKIELDELRMIKFQKLRNNLDVVKEYFRHGDILIKEVNSTLEETRSLIDSNSETSFTQQDFNDMLDIRNAVLSPIFQNASFAQEFIPYDGQYVPETPVIDTTPIVTTNDNISNGILYSSTTRTVVGNKVIKEVVTNFSLGVPTEVNTAEYFDTYNKTTIVRFSNNVENFKVITTISGNIIEVLNTNYENNLPISTTYTKYIDGILLETITNNI